MSLLQHGIILVTLSFCLLVYAFKQSVPKNTEQYSVANRNVGIFALTATLVMTEFNTATLISFSSLGYLSGLKALVLPLIFLIGLIFYALTVAKKWKEFNGLSVVDFFIHRYGSTVGLIATLFLFMAMAGFSATYLKSLTLLFENVFPDTSYWIISAYIVFLTLFMVIRKGLVSIMKVDVFAFVIVLVMLPWILYKTWAEDFVLEIPIHTPAFNSEILGADFVWSLIFLTMFSYILAPWYGQRIFAAKSIRVAYISVIISAFFVFLFYSIGVLISYVLALKGLDLSNPEKSFPYALGFSLKNYFYPAGYVLLFLISSTTLTGVWNAMANITLEFTKPIKIKNKNIIMMLVCAFVTYFLSNMLVDNILNKMILANIPIVSLSFALFAGFYWPKVTLPGIYTSVAIGIVLGIGFYLYFGEAGCYTFYWAFIGIPIIFISGFLVSWLYPVESCKIQKLNLDNKSI